MVTKFLIIAKSNDPLNPPKVFAGWGFKNPVWNNAPKADSRYASPTLVLFDSAELALSQSNILNAEGTGLSEDYVVDVFECGIICPVLEIA